MRSSDGTVSQRGSGIETAPKVCSANAGTVNPDVRVTVRIDRDRCIASGMCVASASTAFDIDDDGVVTTLAGVDALAPDRLRQIVAQCPSGALSLAE
jgi:ferredoxin